MNIDFYPTRNAARHLTLGVAVRTDVLRRLRNRIGMVALASIIAMAGLVRPADAQDQIAELVRVQQQVQNVVSKVMESCVAISDGEGFGSGVIVSEDGLVLTAGHVMSTRGPYEIIMPSGRRVKARPLGKNLSVDAGMVQIEEPGPWPAVPLADRMPRRGEWVVTLGHSGGFELGRKPPVRTGRVLGRRQGQLVTDSILIGGDSGGPLFNLDGELVAIHSSIGDSIAQNRHVPITTFRDHWARMEKGESWGQLPELARKKERRSPDPSAGGDADRGTSGARPRIGVSVSRSMPHATIVTVHPQSPAERAGLKVGDEIIQIGNQKIESGDELIAFIARQSPGDRFELKYIRDGVVRGTVVQLESTR